MKTSPMSFTFLSVKSQSLREHEKLPSQVQLNTGIITVRVKII